MKRTKLNLIIDGLLLLCMACIVGLGLLIKFVLIPGSQRWEIYGRNVELLFWGLDRHEWGTIHLIIGCVFLAFLTLHIILHGSMIVVIYRKLIPGRLTRWLTAVIFVSLTVLLFIFPLFVKPEVQEGGKEKGRGWRQYDISADEVR